MTKCANIGLFFYSVRNIRLVEITLQTKDSRAVGTRQNIF